uniref:Immunoglobulin V-set domain-containing protein n=1 Tax=Oncorhynchus kisutch TaxID=8019 RepID=A0A8C7HR18_ONCKI
CVRMSLILLLLLSAFVGEFNALQGTDITLSCNYKGIVNNLQWYRQYPGSRPECLLWILPTNMYIQNTSITTPRATKPISALTLQYVVYNMFEERIVIHSYLTAHEDSHSDPLKMIYTILLFSMFFGKCTGFALQFWIAHIYLYSIYGT